MRIGIDLSSAIKKVPSGIAVTVLGLVEGLSKVRTDERIDLCVRLSRIRRWQRGLLPRRDGFRLKIIQEPLNWLYPHRIDVFHGPDARLPRFKGCALVATIHDVFSLLGGDFMSPEFREMKKQRYLDLCRRAHLLFADSETTRKDIIHYLNVEEDRIRVIPQGVSTDFAPMPHDDVWETRRRFGLEEDYLLFVGLISRRKNVARIVRAFGLMRKAYGAPLKLAIVGKPTYGSESALQAMQAPDVGDGIVRIPSVTRSDLVKLYCGARVALFTTLYEGFGLPVLEAMRCGTPVVTSNVSSLPEVAGDAALLVDPLNEEAIAQAGLALLTDEALHGEYRNRGLERAKGFTWEKTARAALSAYREAAAIARES